MAGRGADLYERYAKEVYRYLYSITGEADLSEELTQETFCQALKGLDTFRGDSSPGVWLCAIAKRLWYKELERRKRLAPLEEEQLRQIAATDDPVGDVEEKDSRRILYRTMQSLEPETREVIYLRLAGEFSFREIGEILGKSEVWARVRFYRGKEQLAKLIGGGANGRK